jgi:molecular chaperone GrpE
MVDPNVNENATDDAFAKGLDESGGKIPSPELTLDQEVDLVRNQLTEARDKMFRAQAELENYRKRARRELDDERRYAEISLLRDLLPLVDNMSRAIDAAEKKADAASLLEGLRLMRQQLETTLKQHSCVRIDAEGKPFNPAHHEAVMQQPSAEIEPNTVLNVVQPGYQLHERVVRPAQVIVSKSP